MPRYFSRREAEALLPLVTEILLEIQAGKRELDRVEAEWRELARKATGNGHVFEEQARLLRAELERLASRLNAALQRLTDLDVELKDIELGLVDFRALHEGREVYLCWRLGEPEIGYWHELDTGYAGRQPLPPDA